MTSDFYCNRNSAGGSTQVAKLLTKLVVTKIFSGGNWRYFSIFGLSVSSWYHRHHPFISFQTNILCCNNLSAQFHSLIFLSMDTSSILPLPQLSFLSLRLNRNKASWPCNLQRSSRSTGTIHCQKMYVPGG